MSKSCCFTGHRPDKLPKSKIELEKLSQKIKEIVLELIEEGYTKFYTGMAQGTDITCGTIIVELKEKNPNIKLFAVIPHASHGDYLKNELKKNYDYVLANSNNIEVISAEYTPSCMHERNKFMVNNSECVIAVFNGDKSGTKNTVDFALRNNKRIIQINPGSLLIKEFKPNYQLCFKLD